MRIGICEWTTFPAWHLQEVSHVGRIYGVHVADCRNPTRSDFDRLFPGEVARRSVERLEGLA